jgi:hypothetical protein
VGSNLSLACPFHIRRRDSLWQVLVFVTTGIIKSMEMTHFVLHILICEIKAGIQDNLTFATAKQEIICSTN